MPQLPTVALALAGFLAILAISSGCREAEPAPEYYEDLGTDERPLLPTASSLMDPRLLSGQSEWHAFREPTPKAARADAAPDGSQPAPPADPKVAEEVKTVFQEYNDKLAAAAYAELADFYAPAQAEILPKITDALTALSTKLGELGAALPAEDKLDRLAALLAPTSLLKLDVAAVETKGEKQAIGWLSNPPSMSFLPETDAAAISRDVQVSLGEDGYWYISSPVVDALGKVLPSLEGSVAQLDGLITDAKAGSASAAAIAERSAVLGKMLDALGAAAPDSAAPPAAEGADPDAAAGEAPPSTPDAEPKMDDQPAEPGPDPGADR